MANEKYPSKSWQALLQNVFWPHFCLLCGAECTARGRLCAGCTDDLPRIRGACPRCARPLTSVPGGGHLGESGAGRPIQCGVCQLRPPPYSASSIPYHYAPPVDQLVGRLKFDRQLEVAPLLAELMFMAMPPGGRPDVLIPVPLHATRLTQRGFNQALELARHLRRLTAVPYDCDTLVRVRHTEQQTSLDQRARQTNVADAFDVRRRLDDLRVALIDDVVTTGATVSEAASVLLEAGAKGVEVWAVARTP